MTQRIAIVTGANRGIGFAITRRLAQAGLRVIATARDLANAGDLRKSASGWGDVTVLPLSVDDEGSIAAFRAQVLAQFERIDVLINNAGILPDRALDTLTISPAMMREVLTTNTIGPLMLAQAFMPGMLARNFGRVVNMSSTAGQIQSQTGSWPAYNLSKFALNGLTMQLAHLARGRDVLVNAMCPGWVHTDMGGATAPRTPDQGADTAVWLAQLPADGPTGAFFTDRAQIPW